MSAAETLGTTALTAHFGVLCEGADLTEHTIPTLYPTLRALFERHSVLLFRDQDLSPAAHLSLAAHFGPIEDRKADERTADEAFEIPEVSNIRVDGGLTDAGNLHSLNLQSNQLWHTDGTFLPAPALANILVAQVVPGHGGETEIASTRAAWAAMPESLRSRLKGARLRHRYSHSRAQISEELARQPMFSKWPDQIWPALWQNPATADDAVYIASHAVAVEGMAEAPGQALIAEAIAFCTQPQFVYTHRWRVGDVLIWDERATLHRGRPWDPAEPRRLTSLCVTATEADGLGAMRG
ncbi:MAG: TauD/TfdA family dioxygenase [Pseudomonadota bacterium]